MSRVLVFGGSGFIGTRLCKLFEKSGMDFKILDIKPSFQFAYKYQYCDVTKVINGIVNEGEEDIIINLAAEHADNVTPYSLYYSVNVDGAKNVCNFARQNNINKIIFTSSVAVYGFTDKLVVDENSTCNPYNHYGISKLDAEGIYLKWYEENPSLRNLVIIRPTAVFGEENRGNIYNFFNLISSRVFVMIGDGRNIKSLAYVENIASFIKFTIKNTSGFKLFNYIDYPNISVNELYSKVCNILGIKKINKRIPKKLAYFIGAVCDLLRRFGIHLPLSKIRVTKFCSSSHFSSQAHDTDFCAPVAFDDGLSKTLIYEFKSKI